MQEIIWTLWGIMRIRICGASPEWVLNRLTEKRITFWNIQRSDDFIIQITIFRKDWKRAEREIQGAMCDAEILKSQSLSKTAFIFGNHGFLTLLLLLGSIFAIILPKFVFFYHVTGNDRTEKAQIMRALEDLHIQFGTYGPSIKPQWVKDRILNSIPELQWITITQNGCVAEVVVRERSEKEEVVNRKGFANVVAAESGLITEQSVFSGKPMFEPGDFVRKGELLVSGVVDLDRVYSIDCAYAEIYARTWRSKNVIFPALWEQKFYTGAERQKWWLIIGKKRIKIFGNSSFSDDSCDKIIDRKTCILPGGYEIPISLCCETFYPYSSTKLQYDPTAAQMILEQYVEKRTDDAMIAGQILNRYYDYSIENTLYRIMSVLECHEMIALQVPAQWNNEGDTND